MLDNLNENRTMKLHASGEDYLETILVLHKKMGMVRSVDVARHMGVSKPSVCVAVNTLKDGGFLTMDEDHFLHLTDVGREVAEKIYERHCFFTEQLIADDIMNVCRKQVHTLILLQHPQIRQNRKQYRIFWIILKIRNCIMY